MFKLSKSKSKVPLLLVFALLIGSVLWLYLNRYLTQSRATQPKINITIVPKTGTMPASQEHTVTVFLQPADTGLKLSGLDLTFATTGKSFIKDIHTPTSLAGNDQAIFTQVARTIASNSAHVSYSIIKPEAELPTAAKIDIILKGTAVGDGSLTVDLTKTKIVGKISGFVFDFGTVEQGTYQYTTTTVSPTLTPVVSISTTPSPAISCSAVPDCANPPQNCHYEGATQCSCGHLVCVPDTVTPTPKVTSAISLTPSPTPDGSGNASVEMRLKLQGVVHKPNTTDPIPVKVTLVNQDTFAQVSQDMVFAVDDQGMWSATGSFNAPAADHYYVLVKGPKHLQKKVCVVNPTESAPGTYRCANGQISLKDGNNTFDFSNIYMLVGDLPDQDGVVDSYDISFIRNNLGSTDPKTLTIGDLNYDGRVDSQDYSLVIASLSIKKDEE